MTSPDLLITHIHTVFATVPYPEALTLRGDSDSIGRTLAHRAWSSLTVDELYRHRWELFALTPAAFRYYLPAFMLACLYHMDTLGIFVDNLVFSLTPQSEEQVLNFATGNFVDYFSARVGALSLAECETVRDFLRLLSELYPTAGRIYDVDILGQTLAFWQHIGP